MSIIQSMNVTPQDAWGLPIAIYLWLGGMGGAAFVAGAYVYFRKGMEKILYHASLIGFVTLLVGSIMLIIDLTRPANAYLVFASPSLNALSWITIGSWLIALFMITTLLIASSTGEIPLLSKAVGKSIRRSLRILVLVTAGLGLGVSIYTGILIAVVKAVPFWNNALIPVLFLTSAGGTGVAAIALASTLNRDDETTEFLVGKVDYLITIGEILLIALLLIVAFNGSVAESQSAREVTTGSLAPLFWLGFMTAGVLVPIMLEKGVKTRWSLPLAALLVIVGGLFLRYVVLKAGYWEYPF